MKELTGARCSVEIPLGSQFSVSILNISNLEVEAECLTKNLSYCFTQITEENSQFTVNSFTSFTTFSLHLWSSVDPDFCISLVWNEAVFLLLKHSSPRKVKQKKQEKKHQILSFKLLLQEIQLKNSNIKKVFWNSNIEALK